MNQFSFICSVFSLGWFWFRWQTCDQVFIYESMVSDPESRSSGHFNTESWLSPGCERHVSCSTEHKMLRTHFSWCLTGLQVADRLLHVNAPLISLCVCRSERVSGDGAPGPVCVLPVWGVWGHAHTHTHTHTHTFDLSPFMSHDDLCDDD